MSLTLLLFVHVPLKPFDLKEVAIMVSFPDRYPVEVSAAAAAAMKYSLFNHVYITVVLNVNISHSLWTLFFQSFTLDIPLDQDLPPVMAR